MSKLNHEKRRLAERAIASAYNAQRPAAKGRDGGSTEQGRASLGPPAIGAGPGLERGAGPGLACIARTAVRPLQTGVAAAALAWMAMAAACDRSESSPRALHEAERPIEIVVPTSPATLDPRYSTDAVAVRITRLVHAGLIRLDPSTLAPMPFAARSFRWIDPLSLEVELRRDVQFHDGAPLTGRDVCATLAAIADPALYSPHRSVVSAIASCTETATDRVVLRLAGPHATLLTDLEIPILRADQARDPPHPAGDLDGIGPYRLGGASDGAVMLVPADGSVLPRPAHAVTIRTVHDENARALRLLAGRADIAPNAISPTLLPALESDGRLQVRSRRGANVTYLLFACNQPPFDRAEVRRAVGEGIDRALIARTLLAGHAEVAATFFPPGSMAHPPGLAPLPYDPRTAREILTSLPSKTVTLLTSTDRLRSAIARAIAQELDDVGLSVEVVPLDFGVLMQRLASGDFELATLQMPELTEPNLLRWFFHSSFIPSFVHPSSGANRARYRNPEVDQWLDEAATTMDTGRRATLYGLVANQLARDAPAIPLWHEDQVAVVSPRARGFELSVEGRWLAVATLP